MKLITRFKNILVYLICILILAIPSYPVLSAGKITKPFSILATTHMNIDDIAEYLIYLNYRLTTDYSLARYTNDMSFLDETDEIISEIEYYFYEIEGMNNCSGAALYAIKELREIINESLQLIGELKSKSINSKSNFEKANEYKEMTAQIDELEEVISKKIEADMIETNIGVMISGETALTLRRIQQLNVKVFYTGNEISALETMKLTLDDILNRIIDNIERKTKDPEIAIIKHEIYENLKQFYYESESFIKVVQDSVRDEFDAVQEDLFIQNSKIIDGIIRADLLGAVFT